MRTSLVDAEINFGADGGLLLRKERVVDAVSDLVEHLSDLESKHGHDCVSALEGAMRFSLHPNN